MTRESAEAEARAALIATIDRAITTPTATRRIEGTVATWAPRTCTEYLKQVKLAREWWSAEQRGARESAERAGLTGIPVADAAAFMPWDSDRLVRYVLHLAEVDLAVRTIRKALTALRAWHRLHGLPVPDGVPASEALQTHDASRRKQGRGPKHAEPISVDTALRLFAAAARDPKTLRGTRDSCLLGLAIGFMATPGALVELNRGDVRVAGDVVQVRRAPGEWLDLVHWHVAGEHEPSLCPVESVAAWCGYLDSRDVAPELPLLRGVDQHQHVAGLDPFAGDVDGYGRIHERGLGVILRRISTAAGLDEHPTMTELRLGGIVHRRIAGVPVAELAMQSGVESLLRYVVLAETRG